MINYDYREFGDGQQEQTWVMEFWTQGRGNFFKSIPITKMEGISTFNGDGNGAMEIGMGRGQCFQISSNNKEYDLSLGNGNGWEGGNQFLKMAARGK